MNMDFQLSEELQMLRDMARDFAAEKIAPFADKWDEDHYFPYEEVVKPMGELGFFGTVLPEEYGGNDMGWLAAIILTEEIARASGALRVQINMQALGCAFTIFRYGTDELKKKYIQKLVSAEWLGGFAITEPNAGSDVMAMKSTAVDKGDHWLINGGKTWISNASIADVLIFYAYTDRAARGKGLSAFVIEPKNFNGIHTTNLDKMGIRSSVTGEIYLEDTKVPKGNILGKPGDGAKIVFGSLNQSRLSAAAGGIGMAQACLQGERAVRQEDRRIPDEPGSDCPDRLRDRGRASGGVQGGLAEGPGQPRQHRGSGPGEVSGRRSGDEELPGGDEDPRRLRILHRIPRGQALPGCPEPRDCGRFH
jgi:glutaryl-CoA dehydrogenase (non-decarboxylating)